MTVRTGPLGRRSTVRRGPEAQGRFSVEGSQAMVREAGGPRTWETNAILAHVGSCGGSPDEDKPAGSSGILERDAPPVRLSAR